MDQLRTEHLTMEEGRKGLAEFISDFEALFKLDCEGKLILDEERKLRMKEFYGKHSFNIAMCIDLNDFIAPNEYEGDYGFYYAYGQVRPLIKRAKRILQII